MLELDTGTRNVVMAHRRLRMAGWMLETVGPPTGMSADFVATYTRKGVMGYMLRDQQEPYDILLWILGETW